MANKTINELEDGGELRAGDEFPIFRDNITQKATFETFQNSLINSIWPVGSIFISTRDDNPSDYMFGTSWNAYGQGRVLVGEGAGDDGVNPNKIFNGGETGGEYLHTLTEAEMPRHTHGYTDRYDPRGGEYQQDDEGNDPGGTIRQDQETSEPAGGNMPHENMPPYIVVYMWVRVG